MKLIVLVLLVGASPAYAQMYKCVDQRGVTHYTDKPCKGGKQVDIQGQPPISGQLREPAKEDFSQQEADFKRRQFERERAEAQDKSALQARCRSARSEYNLLSRGTRVYKTGADGKRQYLEDPQREQRLAQLQDQLRGCP